MHKILSNKKAIVLFLFPTVLLISIFVVVPICMSVYYSMLNWDGIGKGTFIGLQNYIDMISDTRFTSSIKNSLLYAAFSLFLQLPFSLLLAIVVANVTRGEKFYRTTFFIPVIISGVVIGQLWQKIYNGDYGLLNAVLGMFGVEGQDWLGQENTALLAAFVPNLWQYIGYHMLIMYAGIKSISPPCQQFVSIRLMPHVPYQLVFGKVQKKMQRHSQFHCAQIGAQMPPCHADDPNQKIPNLLRQRVPVLFPHPLYIICLLYGFQKHISPYLSHHILSKAQAGVVAQAPRNQCVLCISASISCFKNSCLP